MPLGAAPVVDDARGRAVALSVAMLAVLLAWAWLLPYTGEGDSVMHFLNAWDARANVKDLLYPWARPLFKVLITPASAWGIFAARAVICVVSAAVVYHTVRLAQDLRLARPLSAGVLLMLHPFVFANASDTMSELPMALGLVIAVRLWINGWKNLSCLAIGFTPLLRPEGFFMGAMWGVLIIVDFGLRIAEWKWPRGARRGFEVIGQPTDDRPSTQSAILNPRSAIETLLLRGLLLSTGLLTWSLACQVLGDGDPLLWVRAWSWPMQSYDYYRSGSLLYHVWSWPAYMGPALIVPFVLGLVVLRRFPAAWLAAAVFGVVFVVHSVLFWGHWFASAGLLRIFACVGPFTSILCLLGWNAIADAMARRWSARAVRLATIGATAFAAGCVVVTYFIDVAHWYTFPAKECAAFVRRERLIDDGRAPAMFFGNEILKADLNVPRGDHVMLNPCDPDYIRKWIAAAPVGTIGVWDNQQAQVWHGVTIDDLVKGGFTVLFESTLDRNPFARVLARWSHGPSVRFVVVRKEQ